MSASIDLDAILRDIGPRCAAQAAAGDAAAAFVAEAYDALRAHKVFSALVPAAYGGGGATHGAMCGFLRGLARNCPSTALALSMHQHLVATALANDRAGRPGRALLEKVAAAEAILVSTGANDWLDSNGTAERVDGGYRVTAVKPFASGSPKGDLMVTSAAYDDPADGAQVLHFPLPLSAAGVTPQGDWDALGMRGTGSQTVRLDAVFVPEAAVVLRRPRGAFHPALAVVLTAALPLIMAAYLGTAEAAAAIARDRAGLRPDDPVAPLLVGEMETLLTTAQVMHADMVQLANDLDFVPSAALAAAMLTRKTVVAEHAVAAAEKALEVAGGQGFMRPLGLERLLRDVHGAQFHPLPAKRQQLFAGRIALGLDPVAGAVAPARSATCPARRPAGHCDVAAPAVHARLRAMASFLKRIFGGGEGGEPAAGGGTKKGEAIEYEGLVIRAAPESAGGQWRLAGVIEKQTEAGTLERVFQRADTFASRDEAESYAVRKGKQIIDERGPALFADGAQTGRC
ncbi:MAG: HlyU family transcriptional regulator [Alphaproteobacteria bacterium]